MKILFIFTLLCLITPKENILAVSKKFLASSCYNFKVEKRRNEIFLYPKIKEIKKGRKNFTCSRLLLEKGETLTFVLPKMLRPRQSKNNTFIININNLILKGDNSLTITTNSAQNKGKRKKSKIREELPSLILNLTSRKKQSDPQKEELSPLIIYIGQKKEDKIGNFLLKSKGPFEYEIKEFGSTIQGKTLFDIL